MAPLDFRKSLQTARRIAVGRSAGALLIAFGAGVAALAAPPLALLALALLGARAWLGASTLRFYPVAVAGPLFAALIVFAFVGAPGAIGTLFAWRLVADARWSVGEARRLAMAAGRPGETRFKALAHAWATPLFGLAMVAYTSPHLVLGLPLDLPHVPVAVPAVLGVTALALTFDWALRRAADWRLGELATAPAAHLLTHHIVFLVAYGLTLDLSAGLVAMAAWRLAHAAPFTRGFAARALLPQA